MGEKKTRDTLHLILGQQNHKRGYNIFTKKGGKRGGCGGLNYFAHKKKGKGLGVRTLRKSGDDWDGPYKSFNEKKRRMKGRQRRASVMPITREERKVPSLSIKKF